MGRDNLNNIEDNGLNAEPYGEINFKRVEKKKDENILFIMIIIIVSALCGGVTASYMIDKN